MGLHILYEDEQIVVCYKPAGVPTQTAKLGEQDMVSLLKNYLKGSYVSVIHRLDQPVEGVLVFAKTPFAAKELNRELTKYGFGKYYRAVLWGAPPKDEDILVDYLVKDAKTNTSRVAKSTDKDAKKAILSYKIMNRGEDGGKEVSLVNIKLETGRHHQIRAQMSNLGCSIWGDTKYNRNPMQDRRFRQMALCAYHLEFEHPKTKKRMIFEIEPKGEGFLLFR